MKTAHFIFFTVNSLWPWDIMLTLFKATLPQYSDNFCLLFDLKRYDSDLNANVCATS